jgi:hypothetical protein
LIVLNAGEYTDQERRWFEDRVCVCGCGQSVVGRSAKTLYVDHRHSQRRYRRKLKTAARAAGLPANLSLQTVETASTTNPHHGDAPKPRPRRQARPRPGVTVYLPTVEDAEAVAGQLARAGLPQADQVIAAISRRTNRERAT